MKLRHVDTIVVGDGPPSSDLNFTIAYNAALQSRARRLLDIVMIHESRGRPRKFLPSQFFALAYLTVLAHRPLHYTQIYETYCGLTPDQRETLGLRDDLHYDQVRYFGERVKQLVVAGRVEMVDLMNGIFDAQIPARTTMSVSVDSTDYETYGRIRAFWSADRDPAPTSHDQAQSDVVELKSRRTGWPLLGDDGRPQRTKDPDARDGHRSAHNNRASGPFVGYDLTLGVNTRPYGSKTTVPNYIVSANLTPAGSHHAKAAQPMIDLLQARGHTITDVPADRAYNYAKPELWTQRLRDNGIEPVFDLTKKQRTPKPGPIHGTVVIDGTLFTQALPENLRHLPAHSRDMTVEKHQELAERYDERYANYGYKPMTTRNRRTRFRGPVRADRATSPIRCPNTPYSMRGSQDRPTTTCASRCGCSGTVTLPDSYLPNIRQRNPYGTTKWFKDYYRRNAVESANSQLRDAQPLERGYTRVFGRIKNAFLLGFTIFAHNQRCIVNHFHLRRQNVPPQFPLTHRPLTPDTQAPAPRHTTTRPRAPSG
ncbi:hypothetical protein [Gordonia spumicola]|nr:hypothetical protein [Gordonia spumicola]